MNSVFDRNWVAQRYEWQLKQFHTFLVLKNGKDRKAVEEKLASFQGKYFPAFEETGRKTVFTLQPFPDSPDSEKVLLILC